MILNIIAACVATAVVLLQIYCAVKAREHTTPPRPPSSQGSASPPAIRNINDIPYNSSASAISAIWLFFQIYVINLLKAEFPQLLFPSIVYSIFVIVASTTAPRVPTMAYGMTFVRQLLITYLTGFGIATGVSLFIIPTSVRKIVFLQMGGFIGSLRKALKAHSAYLESLEDAEKFSTAITRYQTGKDGKKTRSPEAKAVKDTLLALQAQYGKISGDITFAKREFAYGKLGPDDLKEMGKKLRVIMLPMIGLGAVIDIFERLAEYNGWTQAVVEGDSDETDKELRKITIDEWTDIMKCVHEPFQSIIQVMDEGLEHAALQLELQKRPKPKKKDTPENGDVEETGDTVRPGDENFAAHLEAKVQGFWNSRDSSFRRWCDSKGIEIAPDFFQHPATATFTLNALAENETYNRHQRKQRQLYTLIFMEFLLFSAGQSILGFVKFADEKVKSGKMSKNRLIVPGYKRLRKWLFSILAHEDTEFSDQNHVLGDIGGTNTTIFLGEAYKQRKDPEHLPPQNFYERIGDYIRKVGHVLRSPASSFGFRAACATMCLGVVGFLAETQVWFNVHRLLWALIMVAISMSPTAGSSLFGFVLRIVGTVIALVLSLLAWYIPAQNTAGILVFLWFFVSVGLIIPLKFPQYTIVGVISIITLTMIIGYELEVRKLGVQRAVSNGQEYLPITTFGPYRLLTVAAGVFVSFIWTIFPYPISEHSQLRQSLGGALYLLANFYSIAHETIQARIRGDEGDMEDKNSPGRKLEKARFSVFAKLLLVLNGLRQYSEFVKWEIPMGGKFPKKQYDEIITCVEQ